VMVSGPVANPAPDSYQGIAGQGVAMHHCVSAFHAAARLRF
jgi:hypothetical protein